MGLPFSVEWRTQVYGVGGVDSQKLSLGNQENVSALRLPASNHPDCIPQVTGLVSPLLLGQCSLESPTGLGILRQQKETCTLPALGECVQVCPYPRCGQVCSPPGILAPGSASILPWAQGITQACQWPLRVQHVSFNLQFKENGFWGTCWGPWVDVNCYF